MGRFGRRFRREEGTAAVEFALILPVLLIILVGVLEFGRVWSQYQVFQGAAREGARCAAVKAAGFASCDITTEVVNASGAYTPAFVPGSPSVTVNGVAAPSGCTNATRGQDVKVSWVQPLQVGLPAFFGLGNWTINANIAGVFRCE